MRKIAAMFRASWLSASSYRLNMVISVLGLLVSAVPVYFVAHALQPVMATAIQGEGTQYFAFLLLGMVTMTVISTAVNTLPGSIGSGISNGTLEALLATPTRMPTLLAGMVSYGFAWSTFRAAILLVAGWALGAHIVWSKLPLVVAILALLVLAYAGVGLLAASLVLTFRTSGPLATAVLLLSGLLGGVYYPTHVIPSWIQQLSAVVPLTYGLRAMRRTLLDGMAFADVAGDVGILAALALLLFVGASLLFAAALHQARRAGSLALY